MRHSIRARFTALFFAVIAVLLLTIWALNNWGLERFYKREKLREIESAYTEIDRVVTSADAEGISIMKAVSEAGEAGSDELSGLVQPDEDAEERGSGDPDDADPEKEEEAVRELAGILRVCSNRFNISIAIIDSATSRALFSTERGSDYLFRRAQHYLFSGEKDSFEELRKTDNYTILSSYNAEMGSTDIQCMGYCGDNRTFVLMSTPVANLKESVRLANGFLLYVGIACLALGILIVFFTTTHVTQPIRRLAALSEKMGRLDFSERYSGRYRDEVGTLGSNMNFMADKLEETINELKNANDALQADIRKKEEIDEMRKAFIANVSHELKTPIALIQGYAEGLNDGLCEDPESRKYYLDVIIDEANKMNSMVKQLLTLSSLESGAQELELEDFDLRELVAGVRNATGILAEEKNASIVLEAVDASVKPERLLADNEPVPVKADEFKIEEVLTNYTSNAIHHVNEGGTITIRTEILSDRVRVHVRNTGSHIPEEDIGHLWDKFYKVDKAHSRIYGGTGIGLSIVKAVMEAHGNAYGVSNTEEGVDFWFELRKAL